MTSSSLPEHVHARRLAKQGVLIEGTVELQELQRFAAQLVDTSGEVAARLQFRIDEEGNNVAEITVESRVTVACQRCLEPMTLEIRSASNLRLVAGDDDEHEFEGSNYEPYVIKDGELDVIGLVEDELLLELPFAPVHELGSCVAKSSSSGSDGQTPFSILAELKQT
jgi:uncharacterized protein